MEFGCSFVFGAKMLVFGGFGYFYYQLKL